MVRNTNETRNEIFQGTTLLSTPAKKKTKKKTIMRCKTIWEWENKYIVSLERKENLIIEL